MLRYGYLLLGAMLALSACGENYTPREKVATYDPVSGQVVPPHPCPDWSQTQTYNYRNETHSNFGCAVSNDTSLQLAYPQDLIQGHGDNTPDTTVSTHVIEDYRAGKLPVALTPQEDMGAATQ